MSGERNKSQESKTIQAKRPRCGQTETREPITDALTIDSSTPHLSISPESLDALTEVVKNKVLAEIKPLLQQQDNNYFQNMGIKKGNNATASQATTYKQVHFWQIVT